MKTFPHNIRVKPDCCTHGFARRTCAWRWRFNMHQEAPIAMVERTANCPFAIEFARYRPFVRKSWKRVVTCKQELPVFTRLPATSKQGPAWMFQRCSLRFSVYIYIYMGYIYIYNVAINKPTPNIKSIKIKFRPNIGWGSLEKNPDLCGAEQIA